MKKPYKVYAAGPDVFIPGAQVHFDYAKGLARECNIELLTPFDNHVTSGPEIYRSNVALIDVCDGLIANLEPFRGTEPDSGTVWELSRAFAQGKPVVGYMVDQRTVKERVLGYFERLGSPAQGRQMADGMYVEEFGHPVNLMLAHSCHRIVASLSEALLFMESELDRRVAAASLSLTTAAQKEG